MPITETNLPGLLLFGRYAYPPNRLGYCGSEDHLSLLEYLSSGHIDHGLAELARKFQGAYPYLKLIAAANDIRNPFDRRVVEAYWIGNDLLERVRASELYNSLKERFRPRMNTREFSWLASEIERDAKPHHNFHVFDIYRRAGLVRDGKATVALDRMDLCRISWGRVLLVEDSQIVVDRRGLQLHNGKLALGQPQPVRLFCVENAARGTKELRPGDIVSIHWDWMCERLDADKFRRLVANTRRAIANTNTTI